MVWLPNIHKLWRQWAFFWGECNWWYWQSVLPRLAVQNKNKILSSLNSSIMLELYLQAWRWFGLVKIAPTAMIWVKKSIKTQFWNSGIQLLSIRTIEYWLQTMFCFKSYQNIEIRYYFQRDVTFFSKWCWCYGMLLRFVFFSTIFYVLSIYN